MPPILDHGSPSLLCNEVAKKIYWWSLEARVHIESMWIPREENEMADYLSKYMDLDGW